MDWFKFYGRDWLIDGKIITMIPEDRICFITLLCLASSTEEQGIIKDHSEASIISMSHLFEENADNAKGVLQRLEGKGMIHVTKCNENSNGPQNVIVTINAFTKRQSRALTPNERQAKFRAKKKSNEEQGLDKGDVTKSNDKVTESNATVTLDIDKIREDKSNTIARKRAVKPKTPKRDNKVDENNPYTREEFIAKMRESPHAHVRWIADYTEEKKPSFDTKGQWREFLERNLAPASRIRKYKDEQIQKAFEMVQENLRTKKNPKGYITKWGVETILKFLDDANSE